MFPNNGKTLVSLSVESVGIFFSSYVAAHLERPTSAKTEHLFIGADISEHSAIGLFD